MEERSLICVLFEVEYCHFSDVHFAVTKHGYGYFPIVSTIIQWELHHSTSMILKK